MAGEKDTIERTRDLLREGGVPLMSLELTDFPDNHVSPAVRDQFFAALSANRTVTSITLDFRGRSCAIYGNMLQPLAGVLRTHPTIKTFTRRGFHHQNDIVTLAPAIAANGGFTKIVFE